MSNNKPCEGDVLEETGKKIRMQSLISGIFITVLSTGLIGFLSAIFIPIPNFWIVASILTFIAVGYYGLNKVEPGYVAQKKLFGQIKHECLGHGISWTPRIFGEGVDPVDVRVKILEIPELIFLDKKNTKTKYENIAIKFQIVDPYAYRLNTTEEMVNKGIQSAVKESLKENTAKSTYEKIKSHTDEVQEEIKENIEKKLKEEQSWGLNITNIEIGNVRSSETVEQEDQEVRAREKRMKQSLQHIKKLKKELGNLTDAQTIKEVKILEGLVKEEISTKVQENKIELGENTSSVITDVISLIAKKTDKEKTNDQ